MWVGTGLVSRLGEKAKNTGKGSPQRQIRLTAKLVKGQQERKHRLTKTDKDRPFFPLPAELILLVNGIVVQLLGVPDNLSGSHVHAVVQVAEEEEMGELVGQVKLGQLLLLEVVHALEDVVVVLVASRALLVARGQVGTDEPQRHAAKEEGDANPALVAWEMRSKVK